MTTASPTGTQHDEQAPAWLRFTPLYMQRVWGGHSLARAYGRDVPDELLPVGESWELCDRPDNETRVQGGPWHGRGLHELWQHQRQPVFGSGSLHHPAERFPLLLKILDAREVLSVQVHPPGHVAGHLGGEPKDEFWFIADADPEAAIFAGLRPHVDEGRMRAAIHQGETAELLHRLNPKRGQCLSLPSGRVHALGGGLVVFEVQQNSDTTYRVFDWNRQGLDGHPRQLHIEESLRCIDYTDCEPELLTPSPGETLTDSPHFTISLQERPDRLNQSSGEAIMVALTQGALAAQVAAEDGLAPPENGAQLRLNPGDFCLLPAHRPDSTWAAVKPGTSWLEIRLKNQN